MKYWFGYWVIDIDGNNPGASCLSYPYNSYDETK